MIMTGFPRGSVVKNLPTNAEDTGSVLIWEDSTRWGANKPMCHSYRACALECGAGTTEPSSRNYRSLHALELCNQRHHSNEKLSHGNSSSPCSEQLEKSPGSNEDPAQPQINTAAAKSPQSCPTLCDPIDGSPPGCPVPGILQARTLEWVAISFSSA